MDELRLSESFSSRDWQLEERELALLVLPSAHPSFDDSPTSIAAFVLMRRMPGSGGFAKLKMSFASLLVFDVPIAIRDLSLTGLNRKLSSPERMKRIDGPLWQALLQRIKAMRPRDAERLNAIEAERNIERRLMGNSTRIDRLNEQRDGLGLVLDIGHIDRAAILRSVDVGRADGAGSILDLLDAISIQERSLLEHDARIFRELLPMMSMERSAIFSDERGKNSVRVHVTDQTDLETVLGTDLIIYSTRFQSFLLLQYKKMVRDEESWSYGIRPSGNLHQQLARMSTLLLASRERPLESVEPPSLWSYRLNEDPCYFKFCEQMRPSAGDASLIRGITLPAGHLSEFLNLQEARGRRGGISVGYRNCPRYFTNTEFVSLAQSGWIGGGRQSTSLLRDVLNANARAGHAAMLAVVDLPQDTSASERSWRL
jgi:hypothetical protein